MKDRLLLAALCCGTALLCTACAGAASRTETAVQNAVSSPAGGMAEEWEIAKLEAGEMAAVPAPAQAADTSFAGGGMAEDSSASLSGSIQQRKLIRTLDLTVETSSFDQLLALLQSEVEEMKGYVEQSSVSGNSLRQNRPIPRYASLTLRVPEGELDAFLAVVEENSNVTSRSETTEDVTLQYSDLESRKKSLNLEQERLWELLEQADSLESVIALEERLSEIRYQLESLESQLRIYDNQVDYCTVYVNVNEIIEGDSFTPTEPESIGSRIQKGLSRSLEALSQGAAAFFVGLVSLSPFWLPPVLIALLVLFILRPAISRRKKKSGEAKSGEHKSPPKTPAS